MLHIKCMPPPTPTCLPVYPATLAPKPLPHKCEQQTSRHPCPNCVNTEIANTANTPVLPVWTLKWPTPQTYLCEHWNSEHSQHPHPICVNTEIANTVNTPVLPV